MKVVTQLIRHFWQRGAITPVEAAYLVRHGFVEPGDLPGFKPGKVRDAESAAGEESGVLLPGKLEEVEETLVRRSPLRRGGSHEPRGKALRIEDLRKRLQEEYERRGGDLSSILALGRRVDAVESWEAAASELHAVTLDRFHRELCAGLRAASVMLGDLWQASDPEPFHDLVDDDEVRGRPVRSFVALLIASGPDELGRHAWILKYDEMQTLVNLRVVYRRLLGSLSQLFFRNRRLLTHALARDCDRVQVWALVILYNAHRSPRLGAKPRYGQEYGPVDQPEEETWKHAWTAALHMDRQSVTRLLVACYGGERLESIRVSDDCGKPLMCPVGWHIPDGEA